MLVIGSLPKSLVNFRGHLIAEMQARGHNVLASAGGKDPVTEKTLNQMGVRYIPTSLQRAGLNPFKDFLFFLDLIKIMKAENPDIVFSYTVKPVIYGSFAARVMNVDRIFALITGLGFAFIEKKSIKFKILNKIIIFLYQSSLRRVSGVFFQNQDDLAYFLERAIIQEKSNPVRINGSGVDLEKFSEQPLGHGTTVFLMIGRLLTEKGINEFIQAAMEIKRSSLCARFAVLGQVDLNPASVKLSELYKYVKTGVIEYWGETDDVRPHLAKSTVFVLPSYREGLPRSTLEAMATGRPIITTDVPGCRDTVILGENGLIVPARDPNSLAEAMTWCIKNKSELKAMGKKSRKIAEKYFDVKIISCHLCKVMEL